MITTDSEITTTLSEIKKTIYLSIGTPVPTPEKTRILLPHICDPITIKKALRIHPILYDEFDGTADDSTLLYYFKWNKLEKCFEPKDEEAEEELIKILGVTAGEFVIKTEDDTEGNATKLTEEQKKEFHEHIADIRTGLIQIGMGK